MKVSEAFDHCLQIARGHYENFPVASIAIPAKQRPHVAAVYAFARTADDFADEAPFEAVRMAKLKEWEGHLKDMEEGKAEHPIFIALAETIRTFSIPVSLFYDLLTAFKMDVIVNRYEDFEQVLHYCRYSANPVGRIMLYVMGYPAPKFMEYSDAICTALQLANFWQDISVDLEKNRVYLPKEDFAPFNYSEPELFKREYNENFRRLIVFEVERTMALFERGKPLCSKIPGRFGFELRLTWLGGVKILKKILRLKGDVLNQRPKLGKVDAASLIIGALNKKAFS